MGVGTDGSDEGLLDQARAGDAKALGQLLERSRGYLTLLARTQIGRRLQGKVDPADVVQDAFLDAHRQFPRFQGQTEATFLSWLRHILAGQLAHLVRRFCATLGRNIELEEALEKELDASSVVLDRGLVAPDPSPSSRASRREQAVLLADALEQLPAEYREVVVLRQIEGLPMAEVAQRMGRTEDSVQKLWVRGLDRLRRLLERP